MEHDLRETISTYISKYGKTLDQKLGLTRDDLLNDIREQVWKGLLTHNPKGRANLKTYLNTLIKNRFGVLFKRSKIKKNNMVQYYADVYASSDIGVERLVTEETGETVFMKRQIIMQDQVRLSRRARMIYEDLQLGYSLQEMEKKHGLTRVQVTRAINIITRLINKRLKRDG